MCNVLGTYVMFYIIFLVSETNGNSCGYKATKGIVKLIDQKAKSERMNLQILHFSVSVGILERAFV